MMWESEAARALSFMYVERLVLERENGLWVVRCFLRHPEDRESFYLHVEGDSIAEVFRGMVSIGSERTKARKR
jgi:hypothetical protein